MRALAVLALATGLGALGLALLARTAGDGALVAAICGLGASAAGGWTFDPWVAAPLGLSGLLYAAGTARLRRETGRGPRPGRALAFAAGWLALAGALVSPLHRWGGSLFAWHMVEHEIVTAVAAPLLVAARPGGILLWALPRSVRRRIAGAIRSRVVRSGWQGLTRLDVATTLHGAALWIWHAPVLFEAAVATAATHRLQHLAFLLTAILFWWSLLRRTSRGGGAGAVALTMLHTSLLGAVLALAPRLLFPLQTAGAPAWGLTPLEDQQLAGLLMWVPAGTVYAAAALWLAAGWITGSGARWRPTDVVARP